MPLWVLILSYWLHMAATVCWIGGLFFQAVYLNPALQRSLPPEGVARVLESIRRRFDPFAWLSLAVLVVTGLVQMTANPSYRAFLLVENRWTAAILAKHLAILIMVIVAGYQSWGLLPRLARLAWQRAHGRDESVLAASLLKRQFRLTRLNLILALIVLAFTAVARSV